MIEETLLKLTKKAIKKNEVPVAAIITKNNKIISKAINTREKSHNVLGHAEIIAIHKASKKLKTWKLNECVLYTTIKPCSMCMEVIKNSRIKRIYYYLENEKQNLSQIKIIKIENEFNDQYKKIVKKFFKTIRNSD